MTACPMWQGMTTLMALKKTTPLWSSELCMTSQLPPRSRKATFPSLGELASHMCLLLLLLLLLLLPLLLLSMVLMHLIPTRQPGTGLNLPVTALPCAVLMTWGCHLRLRQMLIRVAAAEWQKDHVLHIHSAHGRFFSNSVRSSMHRLHSSVSKLCLQSGVHTLVCLLQEFRGSAAAV
jgi:hypothetical protein